jgi:hypothetical protein
MRLVIAFVATIAMLVLAACNRSDDDGPHRGVSGPYIGGGVGFAR